MPGFGSPISSLDPAEWDDLGFPARLPATINRVVSLVPSLTESIAVSAPEVLVGATDWCIHPADLAVARVRGTKNPDLEAVIGLRPDVVVANEEENRAPDVAALRNAGVPVWVTAPQTLDAAFSSLGRMLAALRLGRPPWLGEAVARWAEPYAGPRRTAVVPIWRRPWMALGRDTFAGNLLSHLGVDNVLAGSPERYPRVDLDALPDHDLIVLPDEPYAFSPADGPEAFPGRPVVCVSGRHLTWYGPSLVQAREILTRQLADSC